MNIGVNTRDFGRSDGWTGREAVRLLGTLRVDVESGGAAIEVGTGLRCLKEAWCIVVVTGRAVLDPYQIGFTTKPSTTDS
jgi:hypothetical protein